MSLTTVFTVAVGVASVVGLVYFLMKTRVALTLTLGGALTAVAMDHAVQALVRRGLRRGLAVAVVVAALVALLAGLALLLVPPIMDQGRALAEETPALWQRLQEAPWFTRLDARLHLQDQLRGAGPAMVGAMNPLLGAIGDAVGALGGLLAFLFLAVFMLAFGRALVTNFVAELGEGSRLRFERMAAKIYRSVGGYLGGLLGICALNATLTTAFLYVVGVPFFLPLGVLSGVASLVPYVGPVVAGLVVTALVLLGGGTWSALVVAGYFVVYGQLEGNLLAPFVYRRTAEVNPLVTLLAIVFLVEFMGMAGAVVAVPLAAVAQVVVAEIVTFRRERSRSPEGLAPPA